MKIIIKNASIEAYYFIGIVKCYYGFLQQVYSIFTIKIPGLEPNLVFQISFKAINNSIGLNELISTLLVFSTYPKMIKLDAPFLLITQHTIAIQKSYR